MKALVVGASAGVGRALSALLAERGYQLLLVASDEADLNTQAAHLRLMYNAKVSTVAVDARNPSRCLDSIRAIADPIGDFDSLFFPIGVSRTDDNGQLPFKEAQHLFDVNLLIIVGLIGSFLPEMLTSNSGDIVGFGSVAAIRGRKANIVYAAAKRGLESYFESLRHLTANTGVRIHFYKLGYIDTQQTFGKKLLFPKIAAQDVAKTVFRNLGKDNGPIYIPRFWSIVGYIVSILPWPIFKRMDF